MREFRQCQPRSMRRINNMQASPWQFARLVIASVLVAIFAIQPNLFAQTHVVSPAELQEEATVATRARRQNEEKLIEFLSSPRAEKALRSAHMDPARVKTAVATLSDAEVAQLASRTAKAQADFAAGTMSDHDLLIILIGIAALVLIIVAVR
jgi:hypothetical protein